MKVFAEIVTVGDELLIGQVVDTNSAWIGKQLNMIGVAVNRITSVRDDEAEILNAVDTALSRSEIVLMTGGLGPTKDDITKTTLCKYFNTELVFNQEVYDNVLRILAGRIPMNELNKSQAYVPKSCTVLQNRVGSASISWFNHKGKVLVSMPGVPQEMKTAMSEDILPRLKSQFNTDYIIHHTFFVKNYAEAVLAEVLEEWENHLPACLKLAYLPQPGAMRLRLTAQGSDKVILVEALQKVEVELRSILKADVFAEDERPIEQQLGEQLVKHGMMVATAESCTGGTMASRLARNAGASAYFVGSIVSYTNDVKMNQLGVKEETLKKHGAVSEETAIEMVNGVCNKLNTPCGLATTGIAGPSGAVPGKPVGTVWIAVKCNEKIVTRMLNYDHGREMNIERASNHAFFMLMEQLHCLK